jgi:CSLREA domain-containing protein
MAKRQRRRRQERRQEHASRRGWQTRHSMITGVGLTAGAVLGMSSAALGATYTVTNTLDPGDGMCDPDPTAAGCTLREAIAYANSHPGLDAIQFLSGLSGTITLYSQIPITDDVAIYGNGTNVTTISGNNTSRIFSLDPTTSGGYVDFNDLTLTGGNSGTSNGGAIYNIDANLNIYGSVLTGNQAHDGGAIYDKGADPHNGTYTDIVNSTISQNYASHDGGGFYAYDSAGQIVASTVSGNTASDRGGGVYEYYSSDFFDSTVSGNTGSNGGGIFAHDPNANLRNTIVSDNTASTGPDISGPAYAGFSLLESTSGTTLTPAPSGPNVTGQDPQLGVLQNNGGATPTRRPAATSPAVDKGGSSHLPTDQRGQSRPVDISTVANASGGDGSDIGAVELTQAEATIPPAPPPPVVPQTKKKCKKKKHHSSAQIAKQKKCKKKKHSASSAIGRARQAGGTDWPGRPFSTNARHHRRSD